ncbi:MAG: ribonuclease E/G [Verrucomicrobiales bacterium]
MIDKIKRYLGFAPRNEKNVLVINHEKLETRVAYIEDGSLEEYNVERNTSRNIVGGIYKGRVKNIEPGLKAMFVDIGFEKNAFLHFWDAIPAALDSGVEAVNRGKGGKKKRQISSKDIPNIYPVGSDVMVQVTKGPIGNKGPRVTTNLSLAGRFLVFMPRNDQSGISRKIDDPKERERLRDILHRLELPDGSGVIMRTVGMDQRYRYFVRDLYLLLEQWKTIETLYNENRAPYRLFEEPDLIERTVRDFLTDEVDAVYCDDLAAVQRMKDLSQQISKRAHRRVYHFAENTPIFERFGLEKVLRDAFHRQVWLPCGGYIVIDETEALVAVDVNTGRNKGGKDVDKTLLQTNLEAADEIARQLRLRNIGGLIVADFIDMKPRRDQQAVYNRLRERLKKDKAKTHVLPISALGILEMTRQRAAESLSDSMFQTCPHCQGRGIIKTPMSMSVEVQRHLNHIMRKHQDNVHEFRVTIHPDVLQRLRTEDEELLVELERKYEGRLTFRSDPTVSIEKFTICDAVNGQELDAV